MKIRTCRWRLGRRGSLLARAGGTKAAWRCGAVAALIYLVAALPARPEAPGGLAELPGQALELVNQSRRQSGLEPLVADDRLNAIAKSHARDMARRGYFSHASPRGATVQDRYVKAGGSRWRLIAENIARCTACLASPGLELVRSLHQGWMASPEHRRNILRRGVNRFGFGVAVAEGTGLFAVETFLGPGLPHGLEPGEEPTPIAAAEQLRLALQRINAARRDAGLPPLAASDGLTVAAQIALPAPGSKAFAETRVGSLYQALPDGERPNWRSLAAAIGACGGCGTHATAADIRDFVDQWLGDGRQRATLLDAEATRLGFALATDGEGKKIALAVLGVPRAP